MALEINARDQLLQSLRGRTLRIPDLPALLQHWPQYVNLELDRLRGHADTKLQELFPEGGRLKKTRAADTGLFAASWWPYARFEALTIATYLSIWLFVWDDELDSAEFSSLVLDHGRASAFRAETLDFAERCLMVDGQQCTMDAPTNAIIASFRPIGEAISKSCSAHQVEIFLKELRFFIEMTGVEQQVQMTKKLPSIDEYHQRRKGSSAVRVCLAITEYCFGMEIPTNVMNENDMEIIWNETNVIIAGMNDLLSVRKEIMQDQVDSLIPLLYVKHGTLEAATEDLMETLKAAIAAFEEASMRLLDRYFSDPEIHRKLLQFIHGCQCACTANLNWSIGSGRYQLGTRSLSGGMQVKL
ncbi:hypothetical protein XANCAGTX0491_009618 [Xanthoria calcicola]